MSSPQTTSDLQAVADAIRGHDGYVVTTHENPDGDALGSLLGMKLALDALGKESVMYLAGDMPLPLEYRFMALDDDIVRGAAGELAGLTAAHGPLQARLASELRMKRTPTLTFEYDPSVERGVRMSQLIDELAPRDDADGD